MKRRFLWAGIGAFWIASLAYGMHAAMRYDTTPGRSAAGEPKVEMKSHRDWTCAMIVHPQCPCTSASLNALIQVAEKHRDKLAVKVVFAGDRPAEPTENMLLAARITDVETEWISAETAKRRYHTFTSGQVFLYSSGDRLEFSGGITPGRGADQPRFALALFDSIFDGRPEAREYRVYGCDLGGRQ